MKDLKGPGDIDKRRRRKGKQKEGKRSRRMNKEAQVMNPEVQLKKRQPQKIDIEFLKMEAYREFPKMDG